MFKKWKAYHSISALSHFTRYDLPRPFSDSSYYIDILNNIFKNKHSTGLIEIVLIYESTHNSFYSYLKVESPKINISIKDVVDIEKFIKLYSERFDVKLQKRDDNRYYYGDGYTRHTIIFHEVPEDFDFVTIECKIGRYDLWEKLLINLSV